MTIRNFVLGNGKSRLVIAPEELRQYGKIYGCNALYRTFSPDYLVAVDLAMVAEIQANKYQITNTVWTNKSSLFEYHDGFNFFTPSLKWSSGPCALQLASSHNPDEVFILGFDYTGINGKINNIYSDTPNYRGSDDMEIYWGNWEAQTEHVIKSYPTIKYYRVVGEDYYDTKWTYGNFRNIKYDEFYRMMTKIA